MRIDHRPTQPVACVHQTAPTVLVDQIGRAIGEVIHHLNEAGVAPVGPPYARTTWEPGTDLEIGVPVSVVVSGGGRVVAGELPGGTMAATTHLGPHDTIAATAAKLRRWIAQQGFAENGTPWEVYVTNPREVPDPNQWEHELVYPVRKRQ